MPLDFEHPLRFVIDCRDRVQCAAQPREGAPETAERVLKAISELGYRPSLNARALAEGRSSTLALMLSNLSNPFYPEFVLAAERAARKAGHFLMVCNTDDDAEIGRAYLNQIAGTLADGVLVMNTDIATNDLLAIGAAQALISLGRAIPDDVSVIGITDIQLANQVHPALTTVAINTTAIAELSIERLIRLIQQPARTPEMVLAPPPALVVRASTGVRRSRAR
jgi:DNA-binding LacI/PurR family transcriptional regulator